MIVKTSNMVSIGPLTGKSALIESGIPIEYKKAFKYEQVFTPIV